MSVFSDVELEFLRSEPLLGRIATVSEDGVPHVVPTGWAYNDELDTIDVGGRALERTKKFRDVAATGRAAIVIDDVLPPWRPRAVEVRGRAEVVAGDETVIRIHPERIVSWGLESDVLGERNSRAVTRS